MPPTPSDRSDALVPGPFFLGSDAFRLGDSYSARRGTRSHSRYQPARASWVRRPHIRPDFLQALRSATHGDINPDRLVGTIYRADEFRVALGASVPRDCAVRVNGRLMHASRQPMSLAAGSRRARYRLLRTADLSGSRSPCQEPFPISSHTFVLDDATKYIASHKKSASISSIMPFSYPPLATTA